jgi:hypothetical protein
MLGKLLKHEIKATARLFLPMYLVILIFAIINKILNPSYVLETSANLNLQTTISIISTIIYFALIVGIVIMTLVIMVQRFYKNLLGDEGYLMFTLPVKTWNHIITKLLTAMLWTILSFLIIILSFITIASSAPMNMKSILAELPRLIAAFTDIFGNTGFFTIPFYAISALASNILMIYSAISLGHLFSKHKLVASFGMYCILYIIDQIITIMFMSLFGRNFLYSVITAGTPTPSQINTFILSLTVVPILLIIGNFILTNMILNKKLNIE